MTREQADTLRPGDQLKADLFGTSRRYNVTFQGWEDGGKAVVATATVSYAVFVKDLERA